MKLLYKSDFEECRAFWTGFWETPEKTRPAIFYPAAKEGVDPAPLPNPIILVDGGIDDFCDRLERYYDTHELSKDTMPGMPLCFGADHFSALLGANLTVDVPNNTTWIEPFVTDWDACGLKVDWNGKIGHRTLECIEKVRQRFDGKVIISPPHLQGNLDCLSAIRGVQPLLYDLIDDPDKIHRALDQVNLAFAEVVSVFRREFDTDRWGSVNRHGLYQPGFSGLLQSDFSCMINPDMFAEFAAPSLTFEADTVDYAEYHLDGPGAIVHAEAVCAIEKIQVIQWQPGAALLKEDWRELHQRIDRCGCGQYFFQPDEKLCRWIMENLTHRNSCLDLAMKSKEEFEAIQAITCR
jgi:hypothetical protein